MKSELNLNYVDGRLKQIKQENERDIGVRVGVEERKR